jgi:hypothetical protein
VAIAAMQTLQYQLLIGFIVELGEAALRIMRVPQTGRLLICIKAQSLNFVNCQL